MGPSGAGKTTFMNFISGRAKSNNSITIEGEICVNNKNINSIDFQKVSSYVKQDEFLKEEETV